MENTNRVLNYVAALIVGPYLPGGAFAGPLLTRFAAGRLANAAVRASGAT